MIKCFKNAKVYVRGRGLVQTDVAFDDKIVSTQKSLGANEIKLPEGATVLPGFIDIHVHGADGCDFMDGTEDAFEKIDSALAREGTTRYLATTMTQSKQNIMRALTCAAQFNKGGMLGVHMEGPFVSPRFAGAQPAEYSEEPNVALFRQYNEAAGGRVKTVTVAPDREPAIGFTQKLTESGIFVSLGHTDASFERCTAAIAAGANRITHTFNAQRGIHHRDIGTAGAALLCDGIFTEIIADGVHVSYPAIRLLLKCKPWDKVVLVTDAIRAKGIGDGESELAGQKVFVKGGEARLADGTLAGSVLTMNRAVANMVNLGVPTEMAADFASFNAASSIGLKGYGAIEEGNAADFAVLLPNGEVSMTIRDGGIIYKR